MIKQQKSSRFSHLRTVWYIYVINGQNNQSITKIVATSIAQLTVQFIVWLLLSILPLKCKCLHTTFWMQSWNQQSCSCRSNQNRYMWSEIEWTTASHGVRLHVSPPCRTGVRTRHGILEVHLIYDTCYRERSKHTCFTDGSTSSMTK